MRVDLERVRYLVREAARLQPGRPALRPALGMGLRAALAVSAPMLIASQIGPLVTTWATLGGFAIVLVDKSGAYRTRAIAMLSAALGGALATLAGTIAADSSATMVVIALITPLCAMAATWPGPAVAVGNTIAVHLIVATTLPHDPARPWVPALGFLAGALWSVVLALFLWPVRVYRPARFAAQRCVLAIAEQAAAIAARDTADPPGWRDAMTRRHRALRETLEAARAVLAATRRGRRGEIGRGERLLVIVESVDQIFGVLIAVEEVVDNLSAEAATAITATLRDGLTAAVGRLSEIADRVVVEAALPPLPPIAPPALPADLATAELPALARAEVELALSLVVRIHEDVAAMAALVDSLSDEREPAPVVPRQPAPAAAASPSAPGPSSAPPSADAPGSAMAAVTRAASAPPVRAASVPPVQTASMSGAIARMSGATARVTGVTGVTGATGAIARVTSAKDEGRLAALFDDLRGSLSLDSAVLRHASRVAIAALASVVVTRALDMQRGYWATLTAVLLLQPYLPATITRGLQRVGGTIAGGMLATLLGAVVHDPLGTGIVAIVFAGVCAAVVQLNYGLFSLFLTPTFILLAEVHARDSHLVALRISNTLLGAGLAVVAALLLWPSREPARTADRLADAINAAAGYAREVFAAVARRAAARSSSVITARRLTGRLLNNADLSLDRLAAEGPPPGVLEAHMTLATMTRRLTATLSAFATARHVGTSGGTAGSTDRAAADATLAAIARDVEGYLRDAAAALRARTPPPAYQRHDAAAGSLPALLASRVSRIDRQLAILSEAVARAAAIRA